MPMDLVTQRLWVTLVTAILLNWQQGSHWSGLRTGRGKYLSRNMWSRKTGRWLKGDMESREGSLVWLEMKVLVTQSCLTLCDPTDCSLPGSPVHRISQTRILEWVAISYSRDSSRPRDRTLASPALAGRFFTTAPPGKLQVGRKRINFSLKWLSHKWRLGGGSVFDILGENGVGNRRKQMK